MKQKTIIKINPVFSALFVLLLIAISVSAYQSKNRTQHPEIVKDTITNTVSAGEEIAGVIADYDSAITFELKNAANVGAAVAVVYKNEIVYLKCFGIRQKGMKDSVNEHTVFRLASVSKTVSGILAGMLIADSTLVPDKKIVEYLPGFKLKTTVHTNQVTLRQILSHTSGMPPHTYDDLVEQKIPLRQIMQKLPEVGHASQPGELYAYQNVMFSLFDTIVAVNTGKSYPAVLKEKIFEPFNMTDATTGFEAFAGNPNKAMPQIWGRNGFRLLPLNDRYYSTLAAAGINASISDMSQFILHLLNESDTLMQQVRQISFEPQIKTRLSSGYFSQWEGVNYKAYGLGWRIIDYKGRRLAYHGGFVKGYRAEIAVCPEENVGIVFLSNSPNASAAKSVPLFLNRFFEQKDSEKLANDSIPVNLFQDKG
ncbi:MAG: serine hydrolase domain-containing protein [Draconibacterium sp.]